MLSGKKSGRARSLLALAATVAMLLAPVEPGAAQPKDPLAAAPEDSGPPAELPPGPSDSARHPRAAGRPEPEGAGPGKPPSTPLRDDSGPDASVRGLDEAAELRGPSARFFEDEGHEPHIVQLYTDPISYRDENGDWKPIGSTVVPTEGGYTSW